MAKVKELTAVAKEVLEFLKGVEGSVTLAEIKEVIPKANSAHLGALKTRELITAEKVEKTVIREVKTKVNAYSVITDFEEVEDEYEDEDDE